MSAVDEIRRALVLQAEMQHEFLDVDGMPVSLGKIVQYVPDEEEQHERLERDPYTVWTERRWGIVVSLIRTARMGEEEGYDYGVKMESVNVIGERSHEWHRDEFTCDPKHVRVIA